MKSRIRILIILFIILPVPGILSCNSETSEAETTIITEVESTEQPSQTATGISLITVDELFQMTESDVNIVIVDVRSKVAYQLSHIKGAISVPDSVISAGNWYQPDGEIPVLY